MISILLYHQIVALTPDGDPKGLAVTPRNFEQHMAYLYHKGYHCLRLDDLVQYLHQQKSLPRKSFVITFDDGFRDLYEVVSPILNRFEFTATIFLVAGQTGRRSNWEGQRGTAAAPLLSWKEARALVAQGFTFGSHTMTHPPLPKIDLTQARHEIQMSRAVISEKLGVPIKLFSYPYSQHNRPVRNLVVESGYTAACGGERGTWSMFNIWRTQCVRSDTLLSFAFKIHGLYNQYIWLREQSVLAGPLSQMRKRLKRPI